MSNDPSIPLALDATKVRFLFAQYFAAVDVSIEVLGMFESSALGFLAPSLLERPLASAIFIWPGDGGLSSRVMCKVLLEVAQVCRTNGNPLDAR